MANRRGGDTGTFRGQVRPGPAGSKPSSCRQGTCVRVRPALPAQREDEDSYQIPCHRHSDRRGRGGPPTSRRPHPRRGRPDWRWNRFLPSAPRGQRWQARERRPPWRRRGHGPRGVVTTVPSGGCPSVRIGVPAPSPHEDAGRAGSGPTPKASCHLNYIINVFIYKTSHILRAWGLVSSSTCELRGSRFSPHNSDLETLTGDPMFHLLELIRGAQVVITPGHRAVREPDPRLQASARSLHGRKARLPVVGREQVETRRPGQQLMLTS